MTTPFFKSTFGDLAESHERPPQGGFLLGEAHKRVSGFLYKAPSSQIPNFPSPNLAV